MTDRIPYQEIVDRLRDHAEQIAEDMLVDPKVRGNEIVGECDGKVGVVIRGAKQGVVGYFSGQYQGKTGGNLITLIELARGCTSHGEAVGIAKREYLGIEDREMSPEEKRRWAEQQESSKRKAEARRLEAEKSAEARKETVREIWQEAKPLPETPAAIYLTNRVGRLPSKIIGDMPSLRCHPSLYCDPMKSRHPALIGGVQGPNKALIALWRIFLTPDGDALRDADGDKIKLGFGPAKGGAVRLGPQTDHLHLCEGIETGFGVYMLNGGWDSERGSVWACLSTSGLIGFELPPGVKKVTIWSDGDRHRFNKRSDDILNPPGRQAAETLKQRIENDVETIIQEPPEGSDWLDVWNSTQEEDYGGRAVQYSG